MRAIIQFLRLVNFRAARHAAGVVVVEVLMVLADGVAHVAVHDLHVVNVVEQLEPLGTDALDQFHAPRHMIALIILVIALAVQQFHAQRRIQFFRQRQNAFQAGGAILHALSHRRGRRDFRKNKSNARNRRRAVCLQPLFISGHEFVVMFDAVERLRNAAEAVNRRIADHRANQSVFFDGGKILRIQ